MAINRLCWVFSFSSILFGYNRRVTNSTTKVGLIRKVLNTFALLGKSKAKVSSTKDSTRWREPIEFPKNDHPGHRFFTLDIADVDSGYDDNAFYNDLDKIEQRVEVPPDYEIIEVEWTLLEENTSETS